MLLCQCTEPGKGKGFWRKVRGIMWTWDEVVGLMLLVRVLVYIMLGMEVNKQQQTCQLGVHGAQVSWLQF